MKVLILTKKIFNPISHLNKESDFSFLLGGLARITPGLVGSKLLELRSEVKSD